MKSHIKNLARLFVELLEERCVPAYLSFDPGPYSILLQSNRRFSPPQNNFFLQPAITLESNPYPVPFDVNGQMQIVQSEPIQEIAGPTAAEWNTLASLSNLFPITGWATSASNLADNSLIVKTAEAMGPDRQGAVNPGSDLPPPQPPAMSGSSWAEGSANVPFQRTERVG